jgi:hypothetical protein
MTEVWHLCSLTFFFPDGAVYYKVSRKGKVPFIAAGGEYAEVHIKASEKDEAPSAPGKHLIYSVSIVSWGRGLKQEIALVKLVPRTCFVTPCSYNY